MRQHLLIYQHNERAASVFSFWGWLQSRHGLWRVPLPGKGSGVSKTGTQQKELGSLTFISLPPLHTAAWDCNERSKPTEEPSLPFPCQPPSALLHMSPQRHPGERETPGLLLASACSPMHPRFLGRLSSSRSMLLSAPLPVPALPVLSLLRGLPLPLLLKVEVRRGRFSFSLQ